ncbi:MAG: DinB family protein [Acidobacteriota bacterium]
MKSDAALDQAAADHRETVHAVVETIRALDPSTWTQSREPGKWSPAQIAEHLRIAYDPPLAELSGGTGFAVRLPGWKRRLFRWIALPGFLRGRFPKGASAPREIRPTGQSESPEEAGRRLGEGAEVFLARLLEAERSGPVRLTHPYFGKLSALQIVKLLTSHARHHGAQFPEAASRTGP